MRKIKKDVEDVRNTFAYLSVVVELALNGKKEKIENFAFEYSKMVINAAEERLRSINMFETALVAVNAAERMLQMNEPLKAHQILQGCRKDIIQKSEIHTEMNNLLGRLKLPRQ